MKKRIITLLAAAIMMSSAFYAQGNLEVTDKTAFIFPGKDSGYFYARVENTGSEPVAVGSGKLVLFSENDDILETSDYVTPYPGNLILEPGDYTYISEFLWNSALKNQTVGDVKFSIEGTDRGKQAEKIPCEASFELNGSDSYDNYVYITCTNDSDEIRYGYYLVTAFFDPDGTLVYVDKNRYEKIGLHPGSTQTTALYIDGDIVDYFESNHIEIGSVDALVYYVSE